MIVIERSTDENKNENDLRPEMRCKSMAWSEQPAKQRVRSEKQSSPNYLTTRSSRKTRNNTITSTLEMPPTTKISADLAP